jgi:hypothetical protein
MFLSLLVVALVVTTTRALAVQVVLLFNLQDRFLLLQITR